MKTTAREAAARAAAARTAEVVKTAREVREAEVAKTARLRALRLAKEAADRDPGQSAPTSRADPKPTRHASGSSRGRHSSKVG